MSDFQGITVSLSRMKGLSILACDLSCLIVNSYAELIGKVQASSFL